MHTGWLRRCALWLVLCVACGLPASAQEGRPDFRWDAESAEHLWNRAGFGAPPEEIERAVELGMQAFVAELLAGEAWLDEPFYTRIRGGGREDERPRMDAQEMGDMDAASWRERRSGRGPLADGERRQKNELRRDDSEQLRDYMGWWVERMVEGADPLRERMTLFWHGHFTSSMQDVKNSHEMILQNQLFRKHALGSFPELLHAIARDPAMLEYLDNDSNRRGSPNENFARELLELFTLGEGNYSEGDVKEAARAFTGWTDRFGEFVFQPRRHDFGEKTVLGTTGRLDGDDVIDILLEEESCALYLVDKLIHYFEGAHPTEQRLEHYAAVLRASDYRIGELLRELFNDPEFYRDQVIGARIAGPIDYVIGSARRLGVEPPAELVLAGATMLGQRLFFPPTVQGWEGGGAWITTSSLMLRGNLSGVMLGRVGLEDFLAEEMEMAAREDMYETEEPDPMDALSVEDSAGMRMGDGMQPDARGSKKLRLDDPSLRDLRSLERRQWRPRLNLTATLQRVGARSDREVVNELASRLLAIPLASDARENLAHILAEERRAIGIPEGELLEFGVDSEDLLRGFAHLVISLPEAQLH